MRFFFDNNLSPHIARAMHCLNQPDGIDVVHLREKFAPSTGDVEWIEHLATEGDWAVVTLDHDITRRGAIKIAWKKAGLVGFVLRPAWQAFSPMEQAWRLIRMWPTIVNQCRLAAPGSTYELGIQGGKIRTL